MSVAWLRERVPGFGALSDAEVSAINDFAFLWSLFEDRILDRNASIPAIRNVVSQWDEAGTLDAECYADALTYVRNRYFPDGAESHRFASLNLGAGKHRAMVQVVLDGFDNDPAACVRALFILVYRYRNNLFHGEKWQYGLQDQLGNFTMANGLLMMALEQHGGLD